ncbi:MAG: hypothetical protein J5709_09875, partial [Bacteroidales bacterium]|nr:hypothetical protein [Bacteroidales bacterium]
MKKIALLFGVLLVFCFSAKAQTRTLLMSNGSTTINCGETINFYDDGGDGANYSSRQELIHYVHAPEGTRIRVRFSSVSFYNNNAFLRLYDMGYVSGSYTNIASGQTPTFTTTSNVLTMYFHSGSSSTTRGGWVATITVLDCPSILDLTELECGTGSKTIGGNLINDEGEAYTENQYVERTFSTAFGSKLHLSFISLPNDLDGSGNPRDYVAVYDGPNAASTCLGKFHRDNMPNSIISTANYLTVRFVSNGSGNGSWSATIAPDACLGAPLEDVVLDCNVVTSYVIGGNYTENQNYSQKFTVSNPEAQLLVDFTALPHDNDNDYVEVYDGEGASATLLGRYFGYGNPRTVASTGNVITIIFHSNATNNGTWSGAVTVDCPASKNMPSTGSDTIVTCNAMIYDNGGPDGSYSNNLDAAFLVVRPGRPGTVMHLEGEFEFDWQNDYITIYDGEGTDGEVLWGGGLHGHGYPRAYAPHTSQAKDCSGSTNPSITCMSEQGEDCDNCLGSTPDKDPNWTAVGNAVGSRCVTYYPKVTSKTGSLTIRLHTNNTMACKGFALKATCLPKPTDCYNTGVVIFSEDFEGNEVSDPVYSSTPISNRICTYGMCGVTPNTGYGYTLGQTHNGGYYAIRKTSCNEWDYFNFIDDHTHPGNIQRGYLFNVDAEAGTGVFYQDTISLDCDGVDRLLVSFWVANINNQFHCDRNNPNLTVGFYTDNNGSIGTLLASETTGPVPMMQMHGCTSDANDWQYYSLELPSIPEGTRKLWFRIENNTDTDDGNDFVLDDIEVRACLPPSVLTRISGGQEIFSSANVCAGDTLVLRANLDYSLGAQSTYSTPYYLWQRGYMTDADTINWIDMNFHSGVCEVNDTTLAETNSMDIAYDAQNNPIEDVGDDGGVDGWENYSEITIYEPPSETEPTYSNHYYRVIIAGTVGALTSKYCHSMSEPYVVTVTRIPEIKFGGTNAICEGGTINLSVTNDSPTPGTWSIFSEYEGYTANTNAPFHASITCDASENYHVVGALHDSIVIQYQTDAVNGGCWSHKTIPIYKLPNITVTPEISTICQGSSITLHPHSNQESSFQWVGTGAPGCSATGWAADTTCADWTVTPAGAGQHTYTVNVNTVHTELDDLGNPLTCTDHADKVVTVLPEPGDITVAGAPTGPVCPGTELTFIPSATGAGTLTYSWDGTNYYEASDPGSTYTVTATTPGTATYTLYVKDNRTEGGVDYSCPATHDVVVEVYNNPSLAISTPVNINCFGQNTGSFTLTGSSPGTSIPYGSGTSAYYEFSNDDGSTYTHATTGNMQQYTFSNLYSGTYQVAIKDGHGCVFKDVVTISETQTAALTPTFESGDVLETCTDQSVGNATISVSGGTTAYTYAWNTVDAPHWTVDSTRQTIENLAVGNYRVTVTDAHGCEATATVSITPRPVPNITASTTADAVCLSASTSTFSVLNGNNPPVASHSWSVTPTDGAGMPADLTTASLTVIPTASTTAPVTYTYTDVVTAENGCVVSGTVSLTVNPTVILDHVSGDLDQTLCFEKTLVPIVFEYSGGASGVTLTWDDPEPASTCLSYSVNTTAHTLTISEGAAPVAGTYRYTVQATGAISPCTNPPYSGTIIIRPELNVDVTGDHQACVTGNIGVATAHPSGGKPFGTAPDTYYEYSWN